ncbi:MAG: hypothetical protein HZB76_07115, partial [Chlamydiae bacterium]|nr:hypothetical protein [Chlamydiota bacterium]
MILSLDKESHQMGSSVNKFNTPFIWSQKNKEIVENPTTLEAGDLFFICNS